MDDVTEKTEQPANHRKSERQRTTFSGPRETSARLASTEPRSNEVAIQKIENCRGDGDRDVHGTAARVSESRKDGPIQVMRQEGERQCLALPSKICPPSCCNFYGREVKRKSGRGASGQRLGQEREQESDRADDLHE